MIPLLVYLAYGLYLSRRMRWCDGEWAMLPIGAARLASSYTASWGRPMPAGRLAWRLPGAYWLYAWASYVPPRWQRGLGRAFSLAVSAVGVAVMLIWARELGGPWAPVWAVLILCSLAAVTGAYATASYEGIVSTLWMAGLYAAYHEAPGLAALCGVALALLRASALPQALILCLLTPSWWGPITAAGIWIYLFGWQRDVLYHNGWVRLFTGGDDAVPLLPRDGWLYGLRVLGQRYEPGIGWALLLLVAGWPRYPGPDLLVITAAVLFFAHAPRVLIRPKWIVGYLPDFALPVILVAAVQITSLPVTWWSAAGVAMTAAWGLLRPRHPAIP